MATTLLSRPRGKRPQRLNRRQRWSDLSTSTKVAVLVVGTVELALTTAAAWELYRRPARLVRGPKALWWPTIFVQPVGPVAYLALGRRYESETSEHTSDAEVADRTVAR